MLCISRLCDKSEFSHLSVIQSSAEKSQVIEGQTLSLNNHGEGMESKEWGSLT